MQTFGLSKVKNRTLPYMNADCETTWINHCQDMHKRNLKRIKPAIDNKWGLKKNGVTDPKKPTYSHLSSNTARARREDERWREVERENQFLLSKMARIMRNVPFDESREFAPGVRLNPGNEPRMDTQIAHVTYSRGAASFTVKRNQQIVSKQQRDQTLKRIADENMALVRRLQATEPAYPVDRLDAQRKETEVLLRSICKYEYQAGSWARERRFKAQLQPSLLLGDDKSALEEGKPSTSPPGARAPAKPRAAPGGLLMMRPDEAGNLNFEISAGEYAFPAGDYELPLSGALPMTVAVDAKPILALSSAGAGRGLAVGPSGPQSKPAKAPKGSPGARR